MNVMDGGLFREGFSGEGESERCLGVHQPTGGKRTQKLGRRVVTGKEEQKRPWEGERAGDSCT